MQFNNKKVLITGAASGIGKIMGRIVLEKGAELIIWDINSKNIDSVCNEFSKLGKVTPYKVDISNIEEVKSTAAAVIDKHGPIDVLINNAGIIVGKYFHEHSIEDIVRTNNINAQAPMQITLEFLPAMMARNSGHICNISSSAGFISNPKMSVYAASKWSVTGWSDSLRLEMQLLKKNIGITTVTPYYIKTGMFDGVESKILPLLNPEKVAAKIISAIEKNRIILSMPLPMHFIRLCQGLLPIRVFDWVADKILGIYSTMDHFKGRTEQ